MSAGRPPVSRICYQFGPFLLDPASRLLLRDGTAVSIPTKAYDLLLILLTNRDRVVDKTEMLELVWQDVVVEENTLTRHISTLRKSLGDDHRQQAIIRTVSGHGYQFVADVTALPERPPSGEPVDSEAEPAQDIAPSPEVQPPVTPFVDAAPESLNRLHVVRFVLGVSALVLCVVAVLLLSPTAHRRSNREDPWGVRQFTFLSGLQRSPSWSPDGRAVVFVSDKSGQPGLWIQRIDEPHAVPLTNTAAGASSPDWSPDGRWIAFRSEADAGGLFVVSANGGTPRRIVDFGYHPRWSPDSARILFSTSEYPDGLSKFYVVDALGGVPRVLRPDLEQSYRMWDVNWRPTSGDISFSGRQPDGIWRFCTTAADGGAVRCPTIPQDITAQMQSTGLSLGRFAWSPSGAFIYFEGKARESNGLWRVPVNSSTLAWQRAPERLTTGTTKDVEFSLSRDGRHLIFSARSTQDLVWAFDFDSVAGKIVGAGHPLTNGAGDEQDVAVSKDARKVAYRAVRGGRNELWERDAVTGTGRLLLAGDQWDRSAPVWSSDGTRLVYSRRLIDTRGNRIQSSVAMLTVGSRTEQIVFESTDDTTLVPMDWSVDGTTLLGHCDGAEPRLQSVCTMHLPAANGRTPSFEVLASDAKRNLWQEQFSPNQQWISFIAVDATDAGVATIYTMPAAGGAWNAITEGSRYDDKPRWSPDGRTLYFVSDRNGVQNVWGRHIDPEHGTPIGQPFRVTSFNGPEKMISTDRVRMQFALTNKKLFVPLEKSTGELWRLEDLDP
jgi:Tol biopolymer transport system component/DNA-binding winged helix-turn-helix (wHTH) protein